MTHAAHIAFIEHELNGFHQSLAEYRQQMGAWYARAMDSVSHAADMPSLLGMDQGIAGGGFATFLQHFRCGFFHRCALPRRVAS